MKLHEICEIKDIRITPNSVILKDLKPVRESIDVHENFLKYQKKKFLLKYIFPSFPFAKKDRQYILITDERSTNYFHWICESLTKLIILRQKYPQATLILPKRYLKLDYVVKSLEAFGIRPKDILLIRKKSNLKVHNLAFIPHSNSMENYMEAMNYYEFMRLKDIRNIIINHFPAHKNSEFGDKIYISRNNPQNFDPRGKIIVRRVANETQITPMLEKYGFKVIYMENHNFEEQIAILQNVKYIVAPHGAGIISAIFMKQDGAVLELINKDFSPEGSCFEKAFKFYPLKKYLRQNCRQSRDDEPNLSSYNGNIEVDLSELEKNIQLILNS